MRMNDGKGPFERKVLTCPVCSSPQLTIVDIREMCEPQRKGEVPYYNANVRQRIVCADCGAIVWGPERMDYRGLVPGMPDGMPYIGVKWCRCSRYHKYRGRQKEGRMIEILCSSCNTYLADTDKARLDWPLTAEMFDVKYPGWSLRPGP